MADACRAVGVNQPRNFCAAKRSVELFAFANLRLASKSETLRRIRKLVLSTKRPRAGSRESQGEKIRINALPAPVFAASTLPGAQRSALPDLPIGAGRTGGAGPVARARTAADSAISRRAYRADHSRGGSAIPSEEGRHAHDGRPADPRLVHRRDDPAGRSAQSLRLAGAVRDGRVRRDRLQRRLPETQARPRPGVERTAKTRFGNSAAPSSPRWSCSEC